MKQPDAVPAPSRDPDFAHAEAALKRAARRARERARCAAVAVVYVEEGVIKWDYPAAVSAGRTEP
jgi:hypothetical protein